MNLPGVPQRTTRGSVFPMVALARDSAGDEPVVLRDVEIDVTFES